MNNKRKISIDDLHSVIIKDDSFEVYSGQWRLFNFLVHSRLNLKEQTDTAEKVSLVSIDQNDGLKVIWQAENSLWDKKKYVLKLKDNTLCYHIEVKGNGAPENIEYFRGGESVNGSEFSVAGYLNVNSQNLDKERSKFMIDTAGSIEGYEFKGALMPLRAAPPPFVFPFWNDYNDDTVYVGLAAEKGKHNFERFVIKAPRVGWQKTGISFVVPLKSYTEINGSWKSPYILIGFGKNDMDAINNYSQWQYDNLNFKKHITKENAPLWWKGPMFCGWGAQCSLRLKTGLKSPDHATEYYYNGFLNKIDSIGLNPSLVMIDDKWQKEYGTLEVDTNKWPDLRAFTNKQHAEGRKVLLWFKLWDAEGVPEDECIMLDGKKYCVDSTNPKYLKRLKERIHALLSSDAGSYNCDGFKLDFMDLNPRMEGAVAYEKGVYGLEMMKRLFHNVYLISKEVKSDCLINMSSVHPYFAEDCDQYRVHDYDMSLRSPISVIKFRCEFANAVMPEVLIDTDGSVGTNKNETLFTYLQMPKLGVPDLYDLPDDFMDEDWAELKKAWDEYRKTL